MMEMKTNNDDDDDDNDDDGRMDIENAGNVN